MEARLCFSLKWEVKEHSEDRQTRQWFYWVGGGGLFLVSNFISECLMNHLVLGMKQPLCPLCHCIFLGRFWGSLRDPTALATPSGAHPPRLVPGLSQPGLYKASTLRAAGALGSDGAR